MNRIAIGACLVCFMGGLAHAADNPAGETECVQRLTRAEELVHERIMAKALSEAEAEEINVLLDEADALCTEGKYKEASTTLDTVTDKASKPQ